MTILPLRQAGLSRCSTTLAEAFMNDPMQRYVFPDEEERKQRSPAHFEAFLRYGLMFGEVYTTENYEGAELLLRPGETELTNEKADISGVSKLPEVLGQEACDRFFSVLDYIDPFHKEDAPQHHWYLMVLGVHPLHQGKGIGKALLVHVLDKARATGLPVYLETTQPANVPFYTSMGFKVISALKEPASGLDIWTFRLDQ
jgi:GNAT superfamily N-acetyltransferase